MKSALWIFFFVAAVAGAQQNETPTPNDVFDGSVQKEGTTEGAITRPKNSLPGSEVDNAKIKQIDRRSFEDQMEDRVARLDGRIAWLQTRLEKDKSKIRPEKLTEIEKQRARLGDLIEELRQSRNATWENSKFKVTEEIADLEGRIARVNDQLKKK
jgi:hypothetical protein